MTKEQAEQTAPGKGEGRNETASSVSLFIAQLRELISRAQLQSHVRITYEGLFVDEAFVPELVKTYQGWLEQKTGGAVSKSERRCMKRLFASVDPPLFYLIEGKQCLLGPRIPYVTKQPQQLGLPFYLGSLLDTRSALHPRDPLLPTIAGLNVSLSPQGPLFKVNTPGGSLEIKSGELLQLTRVIQNSPRIRARSKLASQGLREGLKAFVRIAPKFHLIDPNERLLIPLECEQKKGLEFLRFGSLIAVLRDKNKVAGCYELHGKNLFRFIRAELMAVAARMQNKHLGGFEVFSKQHRYFGGWRSREGSFLVPAQTLQQFVELIPAAAPLRESFTGHYTVRQCLKKFSQALQNSRPVRDRQIEHDLRRGHGKGLHFRADGSLIFAVNRRNIISGCFVQQPSQGGRSRPRRP